MRLNLRQFAPAVLLVSVTALGDVPLERALRCVPDDAGLVVVVPDVAALNRGLLAFGSEIGVGDASEWSVERWFGPLADAGLPSQLREALTTSSALVIACYPGMDEPTRILAVSGAARLDEAAVDQVRGSLRQLGQDHAVADIGGCLVVAADSEQLDAVKQSEGKLSRRLADAGRELLAEPHVFVLIDLPRWQARIEQGIQFGEFILQASVQIAGPQARAGMAFWRAAFDMARQASREGEAIVVAGRIDGAGARVRSRIAFSPAGEIASYLKAVKKPQSELFRGLPDADPFIAIAGEWNVPADTPSLQANWFRLMLEYSGLQDELGREQYNEALQRMTAFYRSVTGFNTLVSFDEQTGALDVTGHYFSDDPAGTVREMGALFQANSKFMGVFLSDLTLEVEHQSTTVGDHRVEAYRIKSDAEDPVLCHMIESIYGKHPCYLVAAAPGGALFTLGSERCAGAALSRALEGKAAKFAQNPRVRQVLTQIEPNPHFCVLIDIARVLQFTVKISAASGVPMPKVSFPEAEQTFTALAGYVGERDITLDLIVPSGAAKGAVTSIKAIAKAK